MAAATSHLQGWQGCGRGVGAIPGPGVSWGALVSLQVQGAGAAVIWHGLGGQLAVVWLARLLRRHRFSAYLVLE
jgi:hypothetical protein